MNLLNTKIILPLALLFLFGLSPARSQDKFNLKPGARGKLCLNCHEDFREKLKNQFVHTPVKSGDCSECHNPHSASHGKLLSAEPDRICYKCHDSVIPEGARSTHKVVSEGNCSKCHDPHGAPNRHNLVKAGKDLCFSCHGDLGDRITKVKIKHTPVEENCLNCHDSHASSEQAFLLKKDEGSLCKECHNTERLAFVKQHNGYPIAEARCTSCHNPHGSNAAGMLFDNVHEPLARRMCTQCHESPNSPIPFKTKKEGFELCRGCHYEVVNETFSKNRPHWPIFSEEGCLSCHSPHASDQADLLKDENIKLCGSCHNDTIMRQAMSETKHEPIESGECAICHSPHASDNLFLMSDSSIIDLCGSCHDWQKHSTHPVGDEIIDMRNSNLTVQCLSCHRSHGTENKHMMPFTTITDTCVQCHVKFKR